ncbi:MAG: glutathione S-transferase family protein [Thermoleophilia bacterium]
MITLYYLPGSAALAAHGALEEAGAEYRLVEVVRENDVVVSPADYREVNPHGRIPALVDGDLRLYEAAAIVMHLSDRFPEAGLAPAPGTPERALWYRWLTHLTNTLQPTFIQVFSPGRTIPGEEAQAALSAAARERLATARDWLDAEVAAGGGYLVGGRFTSADLFLAMLTRWGRRLEPRWWDAPALGDHYRRITERPAIRRVYEQEGLTE